MERRLIWTAVAFGMLLRVRQYAANTSLWHDESFVALNALHVRFRDLLGPLGWHEPSPPGFLAVEKLMLDVFGPSEYALRALPLLGGLAGLAAFAWLARRAAGAGAARWAVVMLAVSPKLVADSAAVKHFSLDLFIAVALAAMAWRLWQAAPPRRAALLAWGGAGAVGLWFSYATAFGIGGTGLVLVAAAARWPQAARRACLAALGLALVSAASLSGAIRAQRSTGVVEFWARAFPDLRGIVPLTLWSARALIALFDYMWQPLGGLLLLLAVGFGLRAQWPTDRRAWLTLLWLPVGLALAASALHWWPFGGNQHMVFAVPAVLLLAAEGIESARLQLARRHRGLACCGLALLLAPGLGDALFHLIVPRQRHEMRPAIEFMEAHVEAGDQLAVFDPATFAFYTGRDMRAAPLDGFAEARRVWVVTPRSSRGDLHPDVQRLVESLQRARPRVAALEVYGAAAYCFGPVGLSPP